VSHTSARSLPQQQQHNFAQRRVTHRFFVAVLSSASNLVLTMATSESVLSSDAAVMASA